jgi:hypothetical protein
MSVVDSVANAPPVLTFYVKFHVLRRQIHRDYRKPVRPTAICL